LGVTISTYKSTSSRIPLIVSPILQGIVFVNEYALVRTLGKGSFGKVKLGLNTHDHELYALKLIPKSRKKRRGGAGAQPLVAEADVLQEITVMKELSHPNIVQLKEVIGESRHPPCFPESSVLPEQLTRLQWKFWYAGLGCHA